MWILVMLLILGLLYAGWTHRPVRDLRYLQSHELQALREGGSPVKQVDVREPADYYCRHMEETVSMYVGRLPYVWSQVLSPGDTVVLIGARKRHIRKAARLLKRRGFGRVYGYMYPCEAFAQRVHPCCGCA
ncbi:rhodanese-like domain-containing protein [Paenibacillus dendritiformis]|uniref:rhodanese-like domain-containing protein n=1 Tax=Paenibacillus dendritiformis TaxID=130049 RepID=UPI000DAAAE78|nr:rhodanese-like domain-containing protein [Paenibacillus dendritiformis]PZM66252.1 hypothetical protein DOE73_07570 [Paenibacillus dendritiformis]